MADTQLDEPILLLEKEVFDLRDSPRASTEFALLQAKSLALSFLRTARQGGVGMVFDHRLRDPLNEFRKRIRRSVIVEPGPDPLPDPSHVGPPGVPPS